MNISNCYLPIKLVFSFFLLFSCSNYLISQDYAEETWRFVPDLNQPGRANIISVDIDSDNIKELIYSSKGPGSLFKILDYKDEYYNEVYTSEIFSKEITWMEVYDHDGDGNYNLFLAMENQKIEVFDIHTRKFIDTIDLPFYALKFFIVDADNNGETEILGYNGSGIYYTDMLGNLIEQKNISGIQDIEIGNVDSDSYEELVVSANESYVLNLKDLTTKWIYYGNFGYDIDLGDPNATGYNLIFGCVYNNIRAYDADLKSPIWEITLQNSINKIKITDLEGDNNLELLIGTGEKVNALLSYDLKSRTLNWEKSIKSYGIHGFLNSDLDGDNVKELVYVCGNGYNYDESLVILDIFLDQNEFETQDYSNDFRFDLGDINNDKISDYFIVSKINYNGIDSNFGVAEDGLTKKTISERINFKRGEFIQNVSMTYYNNEHYILLVSQYGFIIYNLEADKIVVDEQSSPNLISSGGFYIKNNLAKPQVFICLDDGKVRFYDFNISYCSISWSTFSTYSSIFGCKIGNYDDDPNDEIAFQSGGILNIYDLTTHLLNGQYQLVIGGNIPYEIVDVDNNGEMDILYYENYNYNDHKLIIKNTVTSETTSFPVNEIILQIASKNLDSDKASEVLILTKKRLYIYKIDGTIIFQSGTNNNDYHYDANEIKINDIDNDGHMEVIISTRFGIWEFKITQKYPDVLLPEVDKVNPGKDSKSVALNSELKIFFSEVIDTDSLDSKIILTDQAENNITFNSNFNEDKKMLLIKPVNNLPANHQIIVTISHTIKDLAGNFLDGNKNGKPDDENDNFSWSFFTGSEIDTVGPVFSEVAFLNKFYRGSIIKIEGIVSDSTESIVSEIEFIGYFIDSIGLYSDAKTVKPVDNFFDEAKEEFSFSLETSNLTSGDHKLFLISNDVLGNWSVTNGLPFEIITENPANWTKFDFDYYNTGSNSFSQLNFPLKLKHEFNFINQGYESNVGKPILVDNYLVYSINGISNLHSLECLDINTKKIIWKKTFNISDKIFPPTYSDGLIFVQISNHENSTLVSFDLISGEEKWSTKYSRQWPEDFGPVVYKDRVYIVEGYYATTLGAYDISNGKLIWRKEINKDMFDKWLPAFYNDTLYAFAKTLVAMNPETGKIYYKKDDIIPSNFVYFLGVGSPIVDTLNKQVLLTTGYSIHAFSLINHELSWSLKIDEGIFSNPALFEGKLYLMTINRILELNSLDGTIIWSYEVPYKSSRGYNTIVNNNMVVYSNHEISYLFNRDSRKLELIIEKGGAVIITDKYLVHSSLYGKLKVYEHNTTPVILFGSINIVDEIDCFRNSNGSIETKVFGGIKPYHFKWNDPLLPDSNFVSNLRAGFYAVTISDNNNDTITFSIELPTPTELILTGYQTPSDLGSNTGSATVIIEGGTPPYMIIWDYAPFYYLPDLHDLPPGDFGVKVIDVNGCEKYIVITVENKVGTEEQDFASKIIVFPTVTNDEVTIASDQNIKKLSVWIYNSVGQLVDQRRYENFTHKVVSLGVFPEGIYFLKLTDGENQTIKKIILNHKN